MGSMARLQGPDGEPSAVADAVRKDSSREAVTFLVDVQVSRRRIRVLILISRSRSSYEGRRLHGEGTQDTYRC